MEQQPTHPSSGKRAVTIIVFLLMFSTGLASLLYEVVLLSVVTTIVGTTEMSTAIVLSSFLLGLAIGALIGGTLSKQKHLLPFIAAIELAVALFGFSFLSIISNLVGTGLENAYLFWIIICALLIPTTLMGMEIPLAVALLERYGVAHATGFVYFADTLGGVLGSLLTGVLLIPVLGYHGAMYLGALLNFFTLLLALCIPTRRRIVYVTCALAVFIAALFLFNSPEYLSDLSLRFADAFYSTGSAFYSTYYTKPIYSANSPYQHIAIVESPYFGRQLLLDGHFQISEADSLSYHEYLVLPALAAQPSTNNVLVIGGGDGGALHQLLLQHIPSLAHVDLDEKVIEASREYLPLVSRGSLDDPRVRRFIQDGRRFITDGQAETYDVIIVDLPDPYMLTLAPLYSQEFYKEISRVLKPGGIVVTQAESPYYYLEGFTTLYKTMKSVFPNTYPYLFSGSSSGSLAYIISGKDIDPREVRNPTISGTWYHPGDNTFIFSFPQPLTNYFANNDLAISTDENPVIHTYMQSNYYFNALREDKT